MPFVQRARRLYQRSSSLPAPGCTKVSSLPLSQLNRRRGNLGCKRTREAGLKRALQGGPRTPAGCSYREAPRHKLSTCQSQPGWLRLQTLAARRLCCSPQGGKWGRGSTRGHMPRAAGEQTTPPSERQRRGKAGKHRAAPSHHVSLKERHLQPLYKLLIRHLTS